MHLFVAGNKFFKNMFDWSLVVPGYAAAPSQGDRSSSSIDDDRLLEDSSLLSRIDQKLGSIFTPATIEAVQESCPFVAARNGIIGFGFGGILGLFMSGMGSPPLDATGATAPVTVRSVLQEMSSKTWSSAKNLGKVAVIFSTTECIIEGVFDTITKLE